MSDFFNDLEDVETGLKDGTYPAYIVKSEVITKKDETKAWVLTYRISDGASKGEQVQEWFNTYPHDHDKNENAKKWRKRRLESLGVPESQIPSFNPADAVGIFVIIKVKTNNGFQNVSSCVLGNEATGQPLASNGTQSAPTAAAVSTPAASPAAPVSQADVSSLL